MPAIARLSLLVLSWLAPLANCDGSALDLDHYEVWTERVVQIGSVTHDGIAWPLYQQTFLTVPTTATEMMLADPAVGGGIFWRDPVALDAAGNSSEDCHP